MALPGPSSRPLNLHPKPREVDTGCLLMPYWHRSFLRSRNAHRSQLPRSQPARQPTRVTSIVLDPISGPLRDLRGSHHLTLDPHVGDIQLHDLSIEDVTTPACLVAAPEFPLCVLVPGMPLAKHPDEALEVSPHALGAVGELPGVDARVLVPNQRRRGNRVPMRIQPDPSYPIHDRFLSRSDASITWKHHVALTVGRPMSACRQSTIYQEPVIPYYLSVHAASRRCFMEFTLERSEGFSMTRYDLWRVRAKVLVSSPSGYSAGRTTGHRDAVVGRLIARDSPSRVLQAGGQFVRDFAAHSGGNLIRVFGQELPCRVRVVRGEGSQRP